MNASGARRAPVGHHGLVVSPSEIPAGRRRRRRSAKRPVGSPRPAAADAVAADAVAETTPEKQRPKPEASREQSRGNNREPDREVDRNWRDLTGSAPSQVGVGGALRARDVARPDEADLASAEREVVIVRRQWQPPDGELPIRKR
ncbi:MAG: hypothetical protein JWN47_1790 [Frankiales bacterium]|nr:hypothetical protein [Frankiales bacterium]